MNSATGSAFIFLSLFLLEKLASSVELHADGAFKNTPLLFYQMFTVHVLYKEKVSLINLQIANWFNNLCEILYYFPIAYVLMSEKTTDLYTAVLRRIMEVFHQKFPEADCSVSLMISDFEQAILSSTQTTFPTGRARGCWFHFAQIHFFSSRVLYHIKYFISNFSIFRLYTGRLASLDYNLCTGLVKLWKRWLNGLSLLLLPLLVELEKDFA